MIDMALRPPFTPRRSTQSSPRDRKGWGGRVISRKLLKFVGGVGAGELERPLSSLLPSSGSHCFMTRLPHLMSSYSMSSVKSVMRGGGSGSQLVVGFTLPRILLIFIKPLRLILLSLRVEYY